MLHISGVPLIYPHSTLKATYCLAQILPHLLVQKKNLFKEIKILTLHTICQYLPY